MRIGEGERYRAISPRLAMRMEVRGLISDEDELVECHLRASAARPSELVGRILRAVLIFSYIMSAHESSNGAKMFRIREDVAGVEYAFLD